MTDDLMTGDVLSLAREVLSRPRPLTAQVEEYLRSHHEVPSGEAAEWLREELDKLESYEIELLFSPLFTPTPADRVRFEEVLGEGNLSAEEVASLLAALTEEQLKFSIVCEGEPVEARVADVLIERFLRLLHLDAELPVPPEELQALAPGARCHLRDRIWRRRGSAKLLPDLLVAAERAQADGASPPTEVGGYISFLTDFVRSHRPNNPGECRRFLENMTQAYEADLRKHKAGDRSFYSDELRTTYAGERVADEDTIVAHERAIGMAKALHRALS